MILIILTTLTILGLLLFSILITDIKKSNLTGKIYKRKLGNNYIIMGERLEKNKFIFRKLTKQEIFLINLYKYNIFKIYFKSR